MKSIKIVFLIFFVLNLCSAGCVHDEYIKNTTVHYYDDLVESRRLLQAPTIGPLRAFMDYSQVAAGGSVEKNLVQRMMNITANFFYNLLTV